MVISGIVGGEMKYTNSVKVTLSDLSNIESIFITENHKGYIFKLRTYAGNEINIDYAMYKAIAPLCRTYIAGMSITSFVYKRLYIKDEIKSLLNKIKKIEKQTGDEEYTEVLTERDEYLKMSLERVRDTIDKLSKEED
jgi:small nuclear ribonucleoprotein (snRNP)-like protein